ncbi:TPA: phage tail protein [Klebsiella pneumoniae]
MEVPNFKKSRLSQLITHGLIISGRGGSKGGGGARTPVEANDTVNSRAMASVLDLLGEGVIGGLVDGAKSILLNDTPLQNADGSYNFSGVTWWFRDGSQDQTVIDGFDFIETPKSVGMQLKQTSQVNVSLDSADSDRVRVVMKFPSLRKIDKKSGDTNGTTVQYKFQIDAGNGKGFVDAIAEGEGSSIITLTAKKTGVYYRSYVFDLPKPAKSYTLRAIRLTEDHKDDSYLYDDTYIDSIGEIVNTSLNYPNSVLVGLKINSEQFGSTMPSRSYLIKGLKIRVPSNYNSDTNSYDGNWDGTFKLASSSNPAWILFDLLTNTRYGLGEFVKESMINIGELYQIGRYCDAFVDDGFGGKEKRFAINTQITSRQDAYRVVQDIAGAFRGMVYWAGGMVHITQDSPADPVMLFSNSNVVNGSFVYKGSARKDRYSVALITYNNKEDGYKQSVEYVEDQEAIKRYGIRKTESVAFGCTSRGQAHRVGLWTLYTSRMESDVITFAVGMDSVFLMPGDIVLIADKFRAGRRNSGRITGYTYNSIKLDAPVDLTSVGNHITFLSAEGKMVERDILENGKNITTVTFKTALSSNETPVSDAVWVIAQPDLTPLQARVVSVAEGDDGTSFNITAIQNNPTKYEAIDSGAQLIPQNTTVLDPTFSKPSGLAITEGTYLSSPGNLSVSLTATWQGKSAQYYISWRRSDAGNVSNWKSERVTEEQFELRGVAENGQYDFQVYAVSVGGRKTDPISITYKVLGTMTAPDAPTGLTAVGDYRSIVLNWVNPASVDLDHIEVLASKTNDKSKAQLIAKVSGTTFSHNGLEDSVTWYYWVRAANKRGMLSALNSPLATVATTRDVLSFLQNKITESELGQDLIADINSKAVATEVDAAIDEAKSETKAQVDNARTEAANAVKSAKEALSTAIDKETQDRAQAIANETTARNKAIADEASIRATAISNEVTARTNAIAAEVDARTKAVADEATARAKAVSDEAIARASAITDSVAVEASNRAKAVSDATAALDAKISKEARDRASAVSALDIKTANAINTETLNRISSIEDEARARADALLQEKNNRQSEISNLSTQVQTVNESLAQQISQIAAGTGEQFDSLKIWYFDTNSEGWTEDDGGTVPMSVTDDGWLKSSNSTASCRSPNNMVIDANAYRFLKLRIKKVGKPTWSGKLYWIGASEQGWSESRSLVIDEPEYDANGVATLTIHDIDWRASTTIRRFRFDFLKNQSDTNNLLIDWVAVGRPTPGAGMAALQDEKSARVDADAAEAANRNALAVQMRGSYEGNDLSKVGSGLIFQEQLARVTADKAEAMARQSLETKVDDSISNINKSLDTLNTQDSAMASDITGLKSSLKDKADASALQTLKTSVDQQGSNISTQGQSITKLQNDLSTTNANVSKKADQTALTALQGTVTQQGKDISAANSSITNLKTSLDTTNSNVAKKADATAVNDLTSRVSATEGKVSSQADSIVQLNNSLSNAIADSDVSTKTPNNLIVNPSFERGTDGYIGVSSLSTVVAIQIPHVGTKALKIDPGSSVSPGQYIDFVKGRTYEIGVWAKQVSGTTDNGQGNNKLRVGNSAGAPVFEVPFANLTVDWTKVSKRWKATETGSLPVTLSNYLTAGNRYFDDFYVIDVTDSVAIDANASALSSLQNTVTQQSKDISSQSTSITDLNNSLKTTNDNVAKKADSSAVQTLQNTVTQQGKDISTATSDISSLKSGLATTDGNVAKKADASALQSLQNTVTQQGKDLTSVGSRTTALENSLKATNDNVATKADASSLSTLQNTVSQQGKDITSASDAITSLNNSVGAMTNMGDNLIQDANLEGDGSAFRTQQNSGTTGSIVAFGAYGENSAGARMLKVNATSPGLFANGKKPTPVNGSRKFRYIVRAKGVSGAMNMLLRRWNFNGNTEGAYEDKNNTLTTDWQTITWDTSFSPSTGADGQAFGIYCHPSNAEIWIDSFQVFDITDAVNNDATASALSDLSTKVTKQGDTVSSQGTSITKLQNDLTSTKTDVSKKADSTALQTLQNTVSDQGKTLTSQGNAITALTGTVDTVKGDVAKKADATALNNLSTRVSNAEDKISSSSDAITSLNSSLNQQSKRGANILPDGTFESYSSGYNITNGRVIVTTEDSHGGNKCIRVTRPNDYNANATDNSDNHIFSGFQVRDNAVFYMECWVKLDANSTAMAENVQISVGLSLQYQDNSWQWPAVTKAAKDLSSTQWTKISGYLKSTKSGIKQAMVRISIPNVSSVKAGNSFLIDDLVITDVTDAYNAQQTADATASAVSTLQTTVSKQGDSITSQGDSITTLNNGLATANKAIGTKADASALSSLQNTVTQQGKDIASQSDSVTNLSNALNNVSIGGVNLIKNSGDMTGWSGKTNEIFRGNAVISATTKAGSSYRDLKEIILDAPVDNAEYVYSFFAKGGENGQSMTAYFYNPNSTTSGVSSQGVSDGSVDGRMSFTLTTEWVRYWVKWKQKPGTGSKRIILARIQASSTKDQTVSITSPKLEVGNMPTEWSPAPSDMASSNDLSSLKTTVDANSSSIQSVTSRVQKTEDNISTQNTAITKLQGDLSTTNNLVSTKADSAALQTLSGRVDKTESSISTQNDAITKLNSSLDTTNKAVAKKAEQSSLDTLSGRVSSTENGITAANSSITSLNAAIRAENASSGDLITNPTFDPQYAQMGFTVVTTDTDGVPANCPFKYAAKLASRDHHPNFNTIVATLGDVFEISVLVACGAGNADFNLYLGTANGPTGGIGGPLYNGGNTKATSTWTRVTWKFTVSQAMVDKGYIRPFLQINQSSPFGTVWYVTDWHMRNITAASKAQDTANATSKAVDSLTSTVNQQGSDISSIGSRTTSLENGLSTTNANVAKKADSSALQTLQNSVTQQGKDISSQGTRVTSIENSLTSGANLIPNAKMLNGAQGWGGAATTVDGYAAVNSSAGWQPVSPLFEVTPGDTLDLSMMCLAGQAITVGWGLRFDGPSLSNATIYASNLSYQAGEKKAISYTFVVPAGATTARLQPNTGTAASLTIYNVVVTRRDAGTVANSSAIDSLTSTVQTQGDAISSVGGRTTSLENSLKTTNDNVSKKADSTTVQTLQNTVTQQGKDISAAGTNITSMQASLTRRTVFTVTAKGNGNSANHGLFDESGKNLFTPGRSYALITFKANSDGSTVINTSKTYDVFGSANNGKAMSDDIAALANGVYVCVMTYDEPSGQRNSIASALELLGGTTEVINSLPYRGAYILLGRKGMKAGDGLELRAPTGGDSSAFISTSVEFVNGVMMGLGAAGGVMMKADANASAITTLQNTVTQQGKDITSSSSAITSLQNGLVAANSNIDKKADATALQSLQNTVTQQGKDISTQSGNVTNLQNSLSATNTGLANLVADSDASKKIIGNLLTNSSFERGLEGFSGGASFIKVIDAQSPNSGSKILSCGAGTGTVSQSIAVTKDRTYKIGVFARCQSGTVVDNQSNNKLRIGNSSPLIDFQFKPTDLPTDSTWKEISGTWKATISDRVGISINSSLKSGNQYFDDFYFIDITDIVNIDAASNAVASLTSRVTSAEGTVSSHTGSITNLSNSLNSLNNTVSGKADASALQSLQNTVTQQGKDLSSASDSVTDLKSSLNTLKVQSNPWIDGTFETYDNNQQLGGSTAIVTTDFKSSGSKCLKVTRPANTSGNSDKMIGSYSAVRQSAKYRVEFWAMMPASEAPPSGWTVVVGLHSINKDGGNDWQGITFNEAGLGGRDQWVKFTGVVKVSPSVTRSHVWISTRGQSGSNTPGYAVYIDDFVITDITDAADAQATADANATAISSLQTKVSDIDGKVTAQTSQLSSMQSKVDASSSKVDQLSKTISDSQSTQASLNTSLQSQIDAQASANIKNQADLDSATTSIASIKSTQATQATQISAMAKTQTDMTASLNSQSASIQTLQEAVSNNDALNSTWMVKMQTNNNGQKYAAGIALGVDGKNMQSQFLVQADRFALINTSNGNTTTPFVIDNGVTYMNAAFIKDGSIGSAKVGDLMSSNFQENVRGWRISRDGSMNINGSGPGSSRTVITNGRIEVYDSNNRLRVRMGIF